MHGAGRVNRGGVSFLSLTMVLASKNAKTISLDGHGTSQISPNPCWIYRYSQNTLFLQVFLLLSYCLYILSGFLSLQFAIKWKYLITRILSVTCLSANIINANPWTTWWTTWIWWIYVLLFLLGQILDFIQINKRL